MTALQNAVPGAVPAAFPANETERIQKLLSYQVLDTSAEIAYDDITRLAAYICETETSLVSLVDVSRQWFKSRVGLDATETPRDLAFCAHAILRPEVLVVSDARKDERFANNPLVTGEPHIRFYAGAPLITSEGYAIGTLCVIDYVPKQLKPKQIQALEALARQVVSQLEIRLSVQRIEVECDQKEQALQQLHLAQNQLVHHEKMVSLGQLVAGIAHEINNPVSFIVGNLVPAQQYACDLLKLISLYQAEYPLPSKTIQALIEETDLDFLAEDFPRLLSSLEVGSQRISDIVKSLRTFSRLDESERKFSDLQAGLESTLMILQHRLKAQPNRPKIKVIKHYAALPLIFCCASSLNQVFMNILANAIDALEGFWEQQVNHQKAQPFTSQTTPALSWTPSITIVTELLDTDEIAITIADNGPGVSPTAESRLFDPFFTTKPVGKGTGLGLSISHTIVVKQHQGSLKCFSDPEKGTRFSIKFPLVLDAVSEL